VIANRQFITPAEAEAFDPRAGRAPILLPLCQHAPTRVVALRKPSMDLPPYRRGVGVYWPVVNMTVAFAPLLRPKPLFL
jgi:hypothetical protein